MWPLLMWSFSSSLEEEKEKGMVSSKRMACPPPSEELICMHLRLHVSVVSDVGTAHLLNEPLMAVLIELVSFHVTIKLPYISK